MYILDSRNYYKLFSPSFQDLIYNADTVYLKPEPKGVCLIIGPWNYPIQLVLVPLIGAICAGCCALVKASEISANTSAVLSKYFNKYFDKSCIKYVLNVRIRKNLPEDRSKVTVINSSGVHWCIYLLFLSCITLYSI